MRSQNKVLLVITGFLLMVTLAATANAQRVGANPQLLKLIAQERAAFGLNAHLGGLELTQAQKDQAKAILVKYKSEIQALARENVLARQELNKTIAAGSSQVELEKAFTKARGIEWDVVKLRATVALEVRQILTADQLAKLQQRLQAAETRLQNRQKGSPK